MLSDTDLWLIIDRFRKEVKPRKINCLEDVSKAPNDILIGYYISDSELSLPELVDALKHPQEFNETFSLYYPKESFNTKLPSLGDQIHYNMHPHIIAGAIEAMTGKFSQGYDEIKLIAANQVQRKYRYPSGAEVEYYSLEKEKTANISIFEGGYALPNGIFVRERYITMMLALADVQKSNPLFAKYQAQIAHFHKHIHGIIIAHEKSETEIIQHSDFGPRTLDLELESEYHAKEFLEENGVNRKYFELYHLLLFQSG